MATGTPGKLIWAGTLVFVMLFAGVIVYQSVGNEQNDSLIANNKIGEPFSLLDHNGKLITENAFKDHPTVVFFGFTHCPEVCPTTLFEISGWLSELAGEGQSIRAFFVTIDPERDTPTIMKSYVENFSNRITGITGDPDDVYKLAKSWHVFWKKVPDGNDYTMDHTASIFLADRNGNFKGTIAFGENSNVAVQKLRRLVKSE